MNSSIRLFVVFMIIPVLMRACSGGICLLGKTQVRIHNSLPEGITLTVHCKSKNDDLGVQQIPHGGTWKFHFRPNVFCKTLFFCSMQWPGQFHRFDIYDGERDTERCEESCKWDVKPTGPCLLNMACENWNS
ncbi:hypothetical protein ACJRO7_030013 [Eucalyptus globulus]|uniref:S-protein homolog n=1 Tax=Eucalyptus globulus TaxID=34317 RepID=A0ABD3JAC3_EUCGL